MTGPDSSKQARRGGGSSPSSPQPAQVIDGKYQVLHELSREGNVALFEVRAAEGITRQLAWFEVTTPTERQRFHSYRTAIRSVAPQGLTDIVARPGAYYAVWQPISGVPLSEIQTQPLKRQETIEAIEALSARLGEAGFALSDADVFMQSDQPQVGYLRPVPLRTPEEIETLNAGVLASLRGGRVKPKREVRPRDRDGWLTFVPGLVFLLGAGLLGAKAAQVYLNPPVGEVTNVVRQPAQEAARKLAAKGFRVVYSYGETGAMPIGTIMRQEPDGGTSLPIGRQVNLIVNKPTPLIVPKIEDMTLAQAEAPLKDSTLKLGKVIKVDGTATKTPEGRIIAQIPAAGSSVQRNQPIQVMVSTGVRSEQTFIPDLRGMSYEQARDWARAAGLVVTEAIKTPSDKTENTVLVQDPAPFACVEVGSQVKLTIASVKYTPPSTPAEPLPIPPPYVPPAPPQPVPADGTTPAPDQTPAQQTPPTNAAPPAVDTTPRQVNLSYTFPSDLPAGQYSITVQDAGGEREIMPAVGAEQVAGRLARAPLTVQGTAVFIIRRDGAEYARVPAQ